MPLTQHEPQTLAILQSCARSDKVNYVRQSAAEELCRGWKNDPETLAILQAQALKDESKFLRQAAVNTLSREWKNDAEVQSFLKTLQGQAADSPVAAEP